MSQAVRGLPTSVLLKFLIGATGAFLSLFVLGHMAGNLQVYLGPDAINTYAATLKAMPGPLWVIRVVLLGAFVLHIWANVSLTRRNRAARPVDYAGKKPLVSTFFSRTMLPTGLILLAFVLYHLAHFTLGWTQPELYELLDDQGRQDVFSMVVLGFQQPLVSLSYLIAMGLLGAHLAHGVASVFQTAGFRKRQWQSLVDGFGRLFALIVVLGNISIPIACLLGIVEPAQAGL